MEPIRTGGVSRLAGLMERPEVASQEGGSFGEVKVVLPVVGFVGIAMEMGAGGGVGVFNPKVFDPLEIEEAFAVGEVVESPDGHGGVGGHGSC
mgnify:CR=1 FL=1